MNKKWIILFLSQNFSSLEENDEIQNYFYNLSHPNLPPKKYNKDDSKLKTTLTNIEQLKKFNTEIAEAINENRLYYQQEIYKKIKRSFVKSIKAFFEFHKNKSSENAENIFANIEKLFLALFNFVKYQQGENYELHQKFDKFKKMLSDLVVIREWLIDFTKKFDFNERAPAQSGVWYQAAKQAEEKTINDETINSLEELLLKLEEEDELFIKRPLKMKF